MKASLTVFEGIEDYVTICKVLLGSLWYLVWFGLVQVVELI